MKKLFLLLVLLLPVMANAMKIETDEIDEFTGNRTVITSWESLCRQNIHIRFRQQNNHVFLDFKMFYDNAIVIGQDNKLMIKSTADEIVEFAPVGTFTGEKGGGATGFAGSAAWGINATYVGDVSWFVDNVAKLMRIYTTDFYIDKNISEGDGKKLQKLYDLFNSTITGEQGTITYANYTLKFMKRKLPKGSWELVKEEYKKDLSKDELTAIMDEWKAQSTDKYEFICQPKREK